MADTIVETHTPKSVMINPNYSNRKNRQRIEDDEKELEALMKSAPEGEEIEEETAEETSEVEEESVVEEQEEGLSKEEQTFKKRYGDLRRHQAKKEKEWEEKIAALENKDTQGFAPPASDESLEAWANKYPDVAGIVETIAKKKAEEMYAKTSERFKDLDDLTYETKRTKAETEIRKAHTDFDTLKTSDSFHDWADKQPEWVKGALYDNEDDAKSVIRVIDLYKSDKGLNPAAKKAKAKDAAADVRTKGSPKINEDGSGKKFRESQLLQMTDAEFEKNYDSIMEAQKNGDFIYDVTKR